MNEKYQWLKDRPHLCMSPYRRLDLRSESKNNLQVTCCCNLDTHNNNKPVDLDLIERLKTQMSQGIKPPECHRCYKEEQENTFSERINYLIDRDQSWLEKFEQNPESMTDHIMMGTKFSNLCNLACRTCNSADSSLWSRITKVKNTQAEIDIMSSPEIRQQFFDLIRLKYDEAKKLNVEFIVSLIGGETFLQESFIDCCKELINLNLANDITLHLTSNMTVQINETFVEIFKQFKKIRFVCSIDSTGKNYHYVRWPANFNKVERGMQSLLDLNKHMPDRVIFWIQPIYSLYNIFYINDNLDYWQDWAEKNAINIQLITKHIHRPDFVRPEILPSPYRSSLKECIDQTLQHTIFKNYKKTKNFQEYLFSLSAILEENDQTVNLKLFDKFIQYTADYDKRTRNNSFELNSKLFSLLSEEHIDRYHEVYASSNPAERIRWG
jgi:hypothetical protein